MSTVHTWSRLTRHELAEVLPSAVCLLALGATEQHGPHLATGTDHIIATEVALLAAHRATTQRPVVLLPALAYGASGHHLPLGGTLSLTQSTLHAVVVDLLDSLVHAGARALVVVNGHGGNRPTCSRLIHDESIRGRLVVATVSYWELGGPEFLGSAGFFGHAGPAESAIVAALDPDLRRDVVVPPPPARFRMPPQGADWALPGEWERVDGYVDPGSQACDGNQLIDAAVRGVAGLIDAVAAVDGQPCPPLQGER